MSEEKSNDGDGYKCADMADTISSGNASDKLSNSVNLTDNDNMKDVCRRAHSKKGSLEFNLAQRDHVQHETLSEPDHWYTDHRNKSTIKSQIFFEDRKDFEDETKNEEKVLFSSTIFKIRLSSSEEIYSNDLINIGDENCSDFDQNKFRLESLPAEVEGKVIITTSRILFGGKQDSSYPVGKGLDISLHSSLIGLFALSTDNDYSLDDAYENENNTDVKEKLVGQCIYVQFNIPSSKSHNYSTGGKTHPLEIYFFPSNKKDSIEKPNETLIDLQELFDALSKTAELNPPFDDEDDLNDGPCSPWFNFDEDFCMRLDDFNDTGDIVDDARNEVLKNIDNKLVVPQIFETQINDNDDDHDKEGQFDDADEVVAHFH